MSKQCRQLHILFNSLDQFQFPFEPRKIPLNGIYVLFESGESAHDVNRIVRVGTHTGNNQLPSRLQQHFLAENKDRSIFRKNIGRAILNRDKDPFLRHWNLDLTTRKAKEQYGTVIDFAKPRKVESQVSDYIRTHFRFAVISVPDKIDRLLWESKIISTISLCHECGPSKSWLGLHSPKTRICECGLWIVNELYKEPISDSDYKKLKSLVLR